MGIDKLGSIHILDKHPSKRLRRYIIDLRGFKSRVKYEKVITKENKEAGILHENSRFLKQY